MLHEKAQQARKGVENTKRNYPDVIMRQEETAPDLPKAEKIALEKAEQREKELADADLRALFDTGEQLKENSKKKKSLGGNQQKKPKGIFNWSLDKKYLPEPEDLAADEVPEEKEENKKGRKRK